MKLYMVKRRLVVAPSKRAAEKLFKDALDEPGTAREVINKVRLSYDNGETFHYFRPSEVAVGKPHIIPEAG